MNNDLITRNDSADNLAATEHAVRGGGYDDDRPSLSDVIGPDSYDFCYCGNWGYVLAGGRVDGCEHG